MSWQTEAELFICTRLNLIIDRVSIATVPSQVSYAVPDYVIAMRSVTFKGFKLDPASFSEVTGSNSSPQRVISSIRPLNYVYDGFGTKVIKIYPSSSISVPVVTGDLFNATQIAAGFILDFYRAPDFTSTLNRVPDYLRNMMVNAYSTMKELDQEGNHQDTAGSAYFKNLFEFYLNLLKRCNAHTFLAKQNIMSDSALNLFKPRNSRPMLPPNYPIGGGYGRY